mgnify:CR=1 FL=1
MAREKWGVETDHGGQRMRSRLEVRWATLFESMHLRYTYEPRAIQTSVGGYLPDFYLNDLDLWLEIKPICPDSDERVKLTALAKAVERPVVLLAGFPVRDNGNATDHEWGGLTIVIATPDGRQADLSILDALKHLDPDWQQMAVVTLESASRIASPRGMWQKAEHLVANVVGPAFPNTPTRG